MSIVNYEDVLERLKPLYESWKATQNRAAGEIAQAFPELAETEDDKIRKEIIETLQHVMDNRHGIKKAHYTDEKIDRMISWLQEDKWKPAELTEDDIDTEVEEYWKTIAGDSSKTEIYFTHFNAIANYFYNLAKKVQPVEWDEESETVRNYLLELIDRAHKEDCSMGPIAMGAKCWLKGLHPQHQWKPTEEQLNALDFTVNNVVNTSPLWGKYLTVLIDLYTDLEELKYESK